MIVMQKKLLVPLRWAHFDSVDQQRGSTSKNNYMRLLAAKWASVELNRPYAELGSLWQHPCSGLAWLLLIDISALRFLVLISQFLNSGTAKKSFEKISTTKNTLDLTTSPWVTTRASAAAATKRKLHWTESECATKWMTCVFACMQDIQHA